MEPGAEVDCPNCEAPLVLKDTGTYEFESWYPEDNEAADALDEQMTQGMSPIGKMLFDVLAGRV